MVNQETINKIRHILEARELNDFQRAVKDALKDSLTRLLDYWDQCAKMEMLPNYERLKSEVKKVSTDETKYFYIGHSNQPLKFMYVHGKYPENKKFKELENNLVKSQTYCAQLNGEKGETEDSLIKLFVNDKKIAYDRCLNHNAYGSEETSGFVYVLVYTTQQQ